jgi:hypothetical protein
VRKRLQFVMAVVVASGAVVVPVAAAPTGAADSEVCTNLSTGTTKCEKAGDVEINDGFSRANTSPQWAAQGGQSGGPYGGTLGGGSR